MGAAVGTDDKRSVNVELNVIPFIDLMSCLTAFLLVTAVWTNLAQIKRITSLCGAKLPPEFTAALEACGDAADAQFEVGVEFAARQIQELVDAGIPGLHFYVLNKSNATSRVLRNVKLPR